MNKNPENIPSGPDTALADDVQAHLPKVEHILTSLTKFIHGRKLYAENNPRLQEFSREFESSLKTFFKIEDELVLSIDQYSIFWHGGCVYENDKRDDSIAFLLHRDGIGEITIEGKAGEEGPWRLAMMLAADSSIS